MRSEQDLALSSDRGPEPDRFRILFHTGNQFIELQVANGQSAMKQLVMKLFAMAPTSFNPTSDSGVVVAEDASCSGDVDAFRKGGHDHGDLAERGFQPIQGCGEAAGSAAAARLAFEVEDLPFAATAVADKSVNIWVGDSEVVTKGIQAGVTAGVNDFRTAAAALAIGPGQHFQLGALGEKSDIAITSWAVFWRLWLKVAWAALLAEVVV